MNLHELACEITIREGGKQSLSVAQVKEVIRLLCDKFREDPQATLETLFYASKRRVKSQKQKVKRAKRV